MTPLLTVEDLVVDYRLRRRTDFRALKGVSLEIGPGECVGLVGESGSGKSTLGKAVLGLAAVTSGRITFDGQDITHARGAARRRLASDIQVVFQDPYGSLDPTMTVGEILAEPLLTRPSTEEKAAPTLSGSAEGKAAPTHSESAERKAAPTLSGGRPQGQSIGGGGGKVGLNWGNPRERAVRSEFTRRGGAKAVVAAMLDRVRLPADAVHRYPSEFSGGQRQRIAIARALVRRPRLIVCDEPVSALDLTTQATILDLFVELQRETGVSYLFVSHDLGVVRRVCHRVSVMRQGEIVETGFGGPYAQRMLFASPVADPVRQAQRRATWLGLRG
jgi:ABC-type glutathione transport system ATPase component